MTRSPYQPLRNPRGRVRHDDQPKPCPRCYAPMRMVAGRWECDKHGPPAKP